MTIWDMIDSFACATWLILMCDTTHPQCDMTHSHMRHDSLAYVRRLTGLYVIWLGCVTARAHMCEITTRDMMKMCCVEGVMSHIRVSHVAYTRESCRVYEWVWDYYTWYDLDVWHPARTWDHVHLLWVMSHMRMSHVAYANESCRACRWVVSPMRMRHVTHGWVMLHTKTSHVR